MATSSKRRRMVVLGTLIVVIGVVAAVALWVTGGVRRDNAIENFARAPIGCDTTLDFAETGTYILFVETTGRLDEVRGDCAAPREYDVQDVRPAVSITMIDPDGEQLELRDLSNSVTYSSDGYVGRSELEVDIDEATDHVIRVETTEDASFAVAVGRDPDDGVALLRGAAVAVALVGVVAGLALALAGGREREQATPEWTPAQPGQPIWGGTPGVVPTQPPYRQPPPSPPAAGPPVAAGPPTSAPGGSPVPQGFPGQPGFSGQPHPAAPTEPRPPHRGDPSGGDTAPEAPRSNPFAPPSGAPMGVPTNIGSIPGQPQFGGPTRTDEVTGDGSTQRADDETAWSNDEPGSNDEVPSDVTSTADSDDEGPTPPRGVPRVESNATREVSASPEPGSTGSTEAAERPDDSPIDRWNTSPRSVGDT